jgi:hypothetical protein
MLPFSKICKLTVEVIDKQRRFNKKKVGLKIQGRRGKLKAFWDFLLILSTFINFYQHCSICLPSDSNVLEDSVIEPRGTILSP